MADPSLSIVLPVFNEEAAIAPAVTRYLRALRETEIERFEILVVDDGSRDDSLAVARRVAAADARVRVLTHAVNQGQVAALRTGFAAAAGDVLSHNGIDLPFAPEDTRSALEPFARGADVVVVERRDRSSYGLFRRLVSRGNVLAWRVLFGSPFRDHNFVQFYRREVLRAIEPTSTAVNTVTPELILRARRRGYRVEALERPYHRRETGRSSIRVRTVVRSAAAVVALWFQVRRGAWRDPASP